MDTCREEDKELQGPFSQETCMFAEFVRVVFETFTGSDPSEPEACTDVGPRLSRGQKIYLLIWFPLANVLVGNRA